MLPHILSKVLCHLRGFTSPTFCLHRPSTSLTVSIVSTTQTPQKSNHTQLHKNPHFSQFKKTESSERLMKARPGLTPWRVLHGGTGAPGWFGRNGRLGSGVGFWWWVAISLWFVAAVVFVRWIHRDPSFGQLGSRCIWREKDADIAAGGSFSISTERFPLVCSPVSAGSNTSTGDMRVVWWPKSQVGPSIGAMSMISSGSRDCNPDHH